MRSPSPWPETSLCCTATDGELRSSGAFWVTVLGFPPAALLCPSVRPSGCSTVPAALAHPARLAVWGAVTLEATLGGPGCGDPTGQGTRLFLPLPWHREPPWGCQGAVGSGGSPEQLLSCTETPPLPLPCTPVSEKLWFPSVQQLRLHVDLFLTAKSTGAGSARRELEPDRQRLGDPGRSSCRTGAERRFHAMRQGHRVAVTGRSVTAPPAPAGCRDGDMAGMGTCLGWPVSRAAWPPPGRAGPPDPHPGCSGSSLWCDTLTCKAQTSPHTACVF